MTHADRVRAELEEIAAENEGVLSSSAVLDYAANPAASLHKEFEWDDSAAALGYRLVQAERLIRSVRIVIETRPDKHIKVRAYVSLPRDRGVGYREMRSVLSDAEMRQELLAQARAELKTFERKYSNLEELTDVLSAIRVALDTDGIGEERKGPARRGTSRTGKAGKDR